MSESPSPSPLRPYSLKWLVDLGLPNTPTSFKYCPVRQVSVDVSTGEPRPVRSAVEWSTIANKDGDEGPAKDYGWETVPDE